MTGGPSGGNSIREFLMSHFKIFVVAALVHSFCFGALGNSIASAATKMPAFVLESVRDGKDINSSAFAGKVLLLTFFATWCPPCNEEVPVLKKMQDSYSGAGFSVVALSVDQQGAEVVSQFIDRNDINYPVLMAKAETAMDFGGVYGIPVAFLVNKAGDVVKKYMGYVHPRILENDIKTLLN
jgi:peroxiredoxin